MAVLLLVFVGAVAGIVLLRTISRQADAGQEFEPSVDEVRPEDELGQSVAAASSPSVSNLDGTERSEVVESAPGTESVDAEAGLAATALNMIVRTATGAPISGAEALVVESGEELLVGVSDWRGRTPIPQEALDEPREVRIRAAGFEPRSMRIGRADGPEVVVQLERVPWIAGYVLDPSGAGVTDAMVYALPRSDLAQLKPQEAQGYAAESLGLITTTDADGAFRISGLDRGTRYHVSATVPGYLCPSPGSNVREGREDIELVLEPGFAALLRFNDEQGQPLSRTSGGMGTFVPLDPEAVLTTSGTVSKLLGIGLLQPLPPFDGREQFIWGSKRNASPTAGPVRFRHELPGYRPVDMEFDLIRCDQAMPRVDVSFSALAGAFGRIQLVFQRESDQEWSRTGAARGVGSLRLRPVTGAGEVITLPVPSSSTDSPTLEGIPLGDYTATFMGPLEGTLFQAPELRVRVGEGSTELRIDGGDTGALEFVETEAGGDGDPGPLVVTLGPPVPDAASADAPGYELRGMRAQSFIAFRDAPYRIPFVKPGVYAVAFEVPGFKFGAREWTLVEVSAGKLATVEFSKD